MSDVKSDRPLVIACAGDSITFGFGLEEEESYPALLQKLLGEESSYRVLNLGVNGAALAWEGILPDSKYYLYSNSEHYEELLKSKPDVVIVILGTNDGFWKRKPEVFEKAYEDLIRILKNLESNPKIVVGVPPPLVEFLGKEQDLFLNETLPKLIPEIASKHGLGLIDIFHELNPIRSEVMADYCHPNAKGAAKIAKLAYEAIMKLKLKDS